LQNNLRVFLLSPLTELEEGAYTLLVVGLVLVFPLVLFRQCGRLHGPKPKARDQSGSWVGKLCKEVALQRKARQGVLQPGYLKSLNEHSVHNQPDSIANTTSLDALPSIRIAVQQTATRSQ